MQAGTRGYSLVQDSGAYRSSCGYCNNEGGFSSSSHGMHAYRLTVYDYQELLDQGWRRSGKYLYKPDNKITCCRQYTIRLNVADFKPTKAHKKLLRKWEQYLAGNLQHEQQQQADEDNDVLMQDGVQQQQQQSGLPATSAGATALGGAAGQLHDSSSNEQVGSKRTRQGSNEQQPAAAAVPPTPGSAGHLQQQQQQQAVQSTASSIVAEVQSLLQQAVLSLTQQGQLPQQQDLAAVRVVVPAPGKLSKLPAGTAMTSSCAHAIAASARRWQQQQQASGDSAGAGAGRWSSADQLAQVVADSFNALTAGAQPSLSVTASAAKGHINFIVQQQEQQQQPAAAAISNSQQGQTASEQGAKQQQQQHKAVKQQQLPRVQHQQQQAEEQQQGQGQQQQQGRRLEIRMVPNQFIQEEYDLYCKYQMQQHHDEPEELSPSRYKSFLVDTPLIPVLPPTPAAAAASAAAAAGAGGGGGVPSCGYGSFHQQYWLDGKLVAVGVVDVLPRCLSSKYFFWDPDYAWLSMGRYGALREINWVAAAHAAGAEQLQYYYLGYYIHTCPKMAYKAEYAPAELLCPQRQVWVQVDRTVLQALDRTPYVVLSDLPGVQMQPNLSVPRPVPAPAAAVAAAGGGAGDGLGFGGMPQHLGLQQQIQARQQQRAALAAQLIFLLKQPVRWGALRDSGMLDGEQISLMEDRLAEWRAVVGETAAYLLYAASSELLSVG